MYDEHEFMFSRLFGQWRRHDLAFHADLGSIRPEYYVEFRPFREITLRRGQPVELHVPRFIVDLSG